MESVVFFWAISNDVTVFWVADNVSFRPVTCSSTSRNCVRTGPMALPTVGIDGTIVK